MQPHLLTFTLSSALTLLFFASISTSHNGLTKRYPTKSGGYRCGKIILSQDLIDEAAQQAADWPYRDLNQDSNVWTSIHPVKYEGDLKFPTNLEPWLWPLSPTGQELSDADFYFIVLESSLLNILGVAWEHGHNLHERCIKEPDLSDLLGYPVAFGYRCPHNIYSFETIAEELKISQMVKPAAFDEVNIFEENMPLFRWPISPDENFNHRATDFIIMDNNSHLIGMVYKRREVYFRCRLTIKKQIKPEFVGQALEQEPTIVSPQSVDVFHCHKHFIRSDQILLAAGYALDRIRQTLKKCHYAGFPASYKTAGDSGSTAFYLWPIKIDKDGLLYEAKFNKYETIFAVIDHFTNVHKVIMRISDSKVVDCGRKTVDGEFYKSKLFLFSRKGVGIKSSILSALERQNNLHRELPVGEIGVKDSTRPQKKQKLTIQ